LTEEVIAIIGYKNELFVEQMPQEPRVGESRPTSIHDVISFKAAIVRDRNETRGKALIDKESHLNT